MVTAQVARRIGAKLFDAMPAAEIVSPTIVVDRAGGGRGNDVHAADRVSDSSRLVRVGVLTKDRHAEFW